jgi:hypothetical protein
MNRTTVNTVSSLSMDTIELILFKFRNLLHRLEHPIRQQIKLVMHLAGGLLAHNFENAAV